MSCVEVLATGIKIESNNQRPFWGPINWYQELLKSIHSCNSTFDPLKIKCSRASEGNDQAIFADQKPKGLSVSQTLEYTACKRLPLGLKL